MTLFESNENALKAALIKKAIKIVDELGKLDSNEFDDDEDALDIIEGLIKDANQLRKSSLWKL